MKRSNGRSVVDLRLLVTLIRFLVQPLCVHKYPLRRTDRISINVSHFFEIFKKLCIAL